MRPVTKRLCGALAMSASLVAGMVGFGGVASALPPGPTVVAAVTGTVNLTASATTACPATSGYNYEGDFTKVQIPGVFGDGTTTGVFPSVAIGGTGTVVACGTGTFAGPVPILATGALRAATFAGTGLCGVTPCSLNGSVNGGSFTQVGATAVASINLTYCVGAATCTPGTTVTATAVIQVAPVIGPGSSGSCPGLAVSVCEIAAGPVVA